MFNLKIKKMKVLKYLSFAALSMCFASCSEDNSVTLKVETELGGLSEYVKVKDQEVVVNMSVEKDEDGVERKVITSSLALEVTKSVASDYSYSFEVEVLDENHTPIGTLPYFEIDETYDSDNEDYEYILNAGSMRAQMKRQTKVADFTPKDQEEWEKILKEGAYILIKPSNSAKYVEYKAKSSNTEADASSEDTTTVDGDLADSSSEDWDAMLDSYEEYVDKYIALLKKASAGDMTALTEYPALLSKAQEFGDKMESAKGSMSASQVARYTKINAKMLKVAQK